MIVLMKNKVNNILHNATNKKIFGGGGIILFFNFTNIHHATFVNI